MAYTVIMAIIGTVVVLFALICLGIWLASFIVVACKSFKHSVEVNYGVYKEHISETAKLKRERLKEKREKVNKAKKDKLDAKLGKQNKKLLLEEQKQEEAIAELEPEETVTEEKPKKVEKKAKPLTEEVKPEKVDVAEIIQPSETLAQASEEQQAEIVEETAAQVNLDKIRELEAQLAQAKAEVEGDKE